MQPRIIKILHKHLHSLVLFAALHIFSQTTSISPTELFDGRPVKPLLPGNTKENQTTNECGKAFPPEKSDPFSKLSLWHFSLTCFCLQKWKCFDCSVPFFAKMTPNPLSFPINQTNDILTKRTLNDTKWFFTEHLFLPSSTKTTALFLPTKCFKIALRWNSVLRPKLSLSEIFRIVHSSLSKPWAGKTGNWKSRVKSGGILVKF